MKFWGVEVKAGESLKVVPEDGFIHISQAVLGEQKGKVKGLIPLRLKIEGKKFILGSLSAESIPHVTFDLVFQTEFELSHDSKEGSVFFHGYKGYFDDDEMPSVFDDSEDESMDAMDELLAKNDDPLKKLKPSTNGVKSGNKPEVKVKELGKKEGDDKSSDEDEDEDDDSSSDDDFFARAEEDNSNDDSDDNSDDDDSDDDEDSDDSSSEEETPKENEVGKKRNKESAPVIPSLAKKAKVETKPSKPIVGKAPPTFNKSKVQAQKFQAKKAKKGGK